VVNLAPKVMFGPHFCVFVDGHAGVFPLTWRILLRSDCITTSSKQTEFVGEMDDLENLGPRNNVCTVHTSTCLVCSPSLGAWHPCPRR
jgi:hypothetical protein